MNGMVPDGIIVPTMTAQIINAISATVLVKLRILKMAMKNEVYGFIGKRMNNPKTEIWTRKQIFLTACGMVIVGFITVVLLGAF
jgi:hypothetical protein